MTPKQCVDIDSMTGEVIDHTPRKRIKLNTLKDIRVEMAKVYREARTDIIDIHAGTKLIWMLKEIGAVILNSEIEGRLDALENQNEH